MTSAKRGKSRAFRPRAERMERRLVLSSHYSVPAEVRAILASSPGGTPVRPNTPILPLESAAATATFIDPTVRLIQPKRMAVGQKDFIAPGATLDARGGFIKFGSSTSVEDNATLTASLTHGSNSGGIFLGDNVVVGTGATVIGPAMIGAIGGAATSIGAGAVIDGAIIAPGAFVGARATVGPGVTVPAGYRVLPGVDVTTEAQASNPSLGEVVKVAGTDTSAASAKALVAADVALASGYTQLYQGNSATGGASSAGPIPSAISATGSTIYFGALDTVLGVGPEPTSKFVGFEPAAGTPTFLQPNGTQAALAVNLSYRFPARIVGAVTFNQSAAGVAASLGRSDSIRADEGQPITFLGPIAKLGDRVSIHSPLGQVSTATTTTVVTTTTITSSGATTTTTNATTVTAPGPATATAGTTTATTAGINASGQATTGTVTTTIATKTTNLGAITIGKGLVAGDEATILGEPTATTFIQDNVMIGSGAVVAGSTIGAGAVIGAGAYVQDSTVAPGTVIPAGEIFVANKVVGVVPA